MKPGKRTPGGLGPKEGDFIPPQPGGDGKWRRVVLVQRGKVMGVEVWHGDPPTDPKAKKPKPEKKPKLSRWGPVKETLDLSPVVEKFLLWRFKPTVRPAVTPGTLTPARIDRYVRLAILGKRLNWYADDWTKVRKTGVTDDELLTMVVHEFGVSSVANHSDKRRVFIDHWRKGKKSAFFQIGEDDDPNRLLLKGRDLLVVVRRAMQIPVLTGAEALSILAELDSINL